MDAVIEYIAMSTVHDKGIKLSNSRWQTIYVCIVVAIAKYNFFIILYMAKYESEINQVFVKTYSYFYTIRRYSYG